MKRSYQSILFATAIFLTTFSTTPAHAAGRTASSIPNTILNGKGAPSNSDGINGDFYIDTRSLLIFGPKTNGKWPAPQNLQGPIGATGAAGANGSDGKNGADGKTISNASATAGAVGPAGPQGERGLPGATGPAGPAGPAGPTGATGPQGATGATGASGSGGGTPGPTGPQGATGATGLTGPAGPQGLTGATGLQGEIGLTGATGPAGPTGLTGATGATGPAGATGATGPAGPTGLTGATGATGPAGTNGAIKAIAGTFTINDLSGGTGTSQAGSITGFKAGKNYVVRVKIFAYQPNDNSEYLLPLSVATSAISGTPNLTSKYLLSHSYSYRIGSIRYENSIDIDLTLDGSAVATDYGVTFTVTAGRGTAGTELVKFDGSFVAMEVQTISSTF